MHSTPVSVARPSRTTIEGFALATALLLSAPQLSVGQAAKPADLVGNWALEGSKAPYLTFSDTTLAMGKTINRWHLAGDTLVVDSALREDQSIVGMRRLVKLDGQRLTFTRTDGEKIARVFVRTTVTYVEWAADQPVTGGAIPCKDSQIKGLECSNVELLAFLPKNAIGGASGTDLWGWIDSATGREFVVSGGPTGTAFVEVTDPTNPKYLGLLPRRGDANSIGAQSVKVYKNHAFITIESSSDSGLRIFDLTQLRNVKGAPVTFQETAYYDKFKTAHTLAVNEATGFLYANGSETCGKGLHMVDIRTPTKPAFAGCYTETKTYGFNGPGYVHDTQCVVYHGPDKGYRGREICVNAMGGVIVIADVTDKQQPKTISIFSYPNVGYAHQGWFTEDQRYFFLDDELDETPVSETAFMVLQRPKQQPKPTSMEAQHTRTMVFDLTKLDDPIVLTQYYASTFSVDHNLYIHGRYMYQGNNEAGLRIVDVADPKAPKEVGYLTNIGKAWSTYPFLKNGVVAVPTDTGLYLARLLKP